MLARTMVDSRFLFRKKKMNCESGSVHVLFNLLL